MSTDITTTGYEPELHDVAAEVASVLEEITDPTEMYARATAAQVHHQAVVSALALVRSRCMAEFNTPDADGNKYSFDRIGDFTGVSASGVQKLVVRGRPLLERPFPVPLTVDDVLRFLQHAPGGPDAGTEGDLS
ncbi:hypothetical protein [Streptomyces acidiscabies]|uniref:Uncharacterized protein n=1 Tax=Streptomyces acidiscabies TaxID=42234 RepID=A0AAP6BJ34_9ACTN|nr:hypothetical protein [Streptomyces acidiscabies]MBZ3916681.1 hypothetical protein [Streptomyces acidiscabies]MDX2965683.1 hypothetical protein [Streptomyces acidiscabies]MDX3024815.1 hypothetical protein [Streptomyces acidiscabies]MDX3795599.1 hypothetical protein [Streptomyces acidiscabies]